MLRRTLRSGCRSNRFHRIRRSGELAGTWELEPEDIREHLECGLLSESIARIESANYWWSSSRGASGTRWSLSGPVTVFLTKSVIIIVRRLSSGVWGLYGVAMGADGQDGMAMGWWSLVTVQ